MEILRLRIVALMVAMLFTMRQEACGRRAMAPNFESVPPTPKCGDDLVLECSKNVGDTSATVQLRFIMVPYGDWETDWEDAANPINVTLIADVGHVGAYRCEARKNENDTSPTHSGHPIKVPKTCKKCGSDYDDCSDVNAECKGDPGSRTCSCKTGYSGTTANKTITCTENGTSAGTTGGPDSQTTSGSKTGTTGGTDSQTTSGTGGHASGSAGVTYNWTAIMAATLMTLISAAARCLSD